MSYWRDCGDCHQNPATILCFDGSYRCVDCELEFRRVEFKKSLGKEIAQKLDLLEQYIKDETQIHITLMVLEELRTATTRLKEAP